MAKLRGSIVGETDKAVQLEVTEDERSKLKGKTKWFPKSQFRLDEKEIGILIPDWLHEAKVNEQE